MSHTVINNSFDGKVHIYTGEGKGKTTCAVGLALRAAGCGLSVHIIQFMKINASGEIRELKKCMSAITIENYGCADFFVTGSFNEHQHRAEARKALERACFFCTQSSPLTNMLILDEAVTAAAAGLIDEQNLLSCIKTRPNNMELVLTGRGAGPALIDAADLVTEMKMVKHYYTVGTHAREGIEY